MSNQQLHISDFSLGLMTHPDQRTLPLGAATQADNVIVERRDVRPREGRVKAALCPYNATTGIRAGCEYALAGRLPVEQQFFAVIGTRLYWSMSSVAFTSYAWASGHAYAVGDLVVATAWNAADYLYECTTAGTSDASEPTWGTTPGGTTTDNTATWTCRRNPAAKRWKANTAYTTAQVRRPATANGYLYRVKVAGTSHAATEPTWPTTERATVTDGGVTWECTSASVFEEIDATVTVHATHAIRLMQQADTVYLVDGNAGTRTITQWGEITELLDFAAPSVAPDVIATDSVAPLDEMDTLTLSTGGRDLTGKSHWVAEGDHNYRVDSMEFHPESGSGTDWADVQRVCCRLVQSNPLGGRSYNIMWEFIADGDNPMTDPLTAVQYLYRRVPPGDPIRDLSDSTAITFTVQLGTHDDTPLPAQLQVCFGQTSNKATWTFLPVDMTGWTNDAENEATVSLIGLDPADLVDIQFFGFYIPSLECKAIDRIALTSSTLEPSLTHGVYLRFGPVYKDAGSTYILPNSTYEFSYSYYNSTDGESDLFRFDDIEHQFVEYPIADVVGIPISFNVTLTKDAGSTATDAYLYIRGGTITSWRRIAELSFGAGTTVSTAWNGEYTTDMEYWSDYVNRPQSGMTMLCPYKNRMASVGRLPGSTSGARDVVYLSKLGDPTRVRIISTSLSETPALEGGWADVERFGKDLTGIAPYRNYLLLFKAQGIWALQGEIGQPDYVPPTIIDRVEGCLSQESITAAEDLLIWQARDKILSWDGQRIQEISAPIADLVAAYTVDQQAAAHGVYDPQTRRFYMFYPGATTGTTPTGTALVWQFRGQTAQHGPPWTRWTAQPDACSLYAAHATSKGVYLADRYGTGGTGTLYRLANYNLAADAAILTDALNSGTAAAISWTWKSGEIPSPFAGQYVELERVLALVTTVASSGTYDLVLSVDPSGDVSVQDAYASPITALRAMGSGGSGTAWFIPAHQGEQESVILGLTRSTTNLIAVRELLAVCKPRGLWRGRTA